MMLLAGMGTFGYEPKVNRLFGFPVSISRGGVALDIPITGAQVTDGIDPEENAQFAQQLGLLSSALEHATPEQMFSTKDQPADAISVVKALSKANAQGQRIYELTPANMAETLPNLNLARETEDEIRTALNAGLTVIAHTDPVEVPGWRGAGYIIFDPDTGSGAYKISGGPNGGFLDGGFLALGLSIVLLVNAIFPALLPLSAFLVVIFTIVVAGLTFTVTLDNLNGCGGPIGIDAAIIATLISLLPGKGAAALRSALQGFLFEGAFTDAENAVCVTLNG